MKITDEMVEKACSAWAATWGHAWPKPTSSPIEEAAQQAQRLTIRATLEAVAPMIARAENEACAKVAEEADREGWEGRGGEYDGGACFHIAAAIRARHATPTDSTPQEK